MPNCPNCLKKFKDALGVTRHLGQPLVSCRQHTTVEYTSAAQILSSLDRRASSESNQSSSHSQSSGFSMDLDLPPAWNPGPNSDGDDMDYHHEEADVENEFPIPDRETLGGGAAGGHFTRFQGAAKVHARGLTFLEWFNDDVYAHHRNENLYYPFASFQDWELASFLLSSTLSMAAIDRFLAIELVCFPSPTPDQLGTQVFDRSKPYHSPIVRQKSYGAVLSFYLLVPNGNIVSFPPNIQRNYLCTCIGAIHWTVLNCSSTILDLPRISTSYLSAYIPRQSVRYGYTANG